MPLETYINRLIFNFTNSWEATMAVARKKSDGGIKAMMDFHCLTESCEGVVKFSLAEITGRDFQAVCPKCHQPYELNADLTDKLKRMLALVKAIGNAEDILGSCNVAVNVACGSVKIPYALLLTRLNTMITLNLGGQDVDFHLWIKPSSSNTFN